MYPEIIRQRENGDRSGMRRAALVHELRDRLAPSCSEWPPELFASMVEGLADITLKYEHTPSTSIYERRTTDRLVNDLRDALARSSQVRDRELS